jgi:YebC/PmpR family DNA-binding regulatory protein
MAGHSKWANTKYRKERADKKKGKIFSRIMKEIISAVRQGGADPKGNAKLRVALQKARDANVPHENIERNIKKAATLDQADYAEMTYEIYGYGGVGLIVDAMTDNKNRIASEIRVVLNKCGGTMATPGSVSYNFMRKGRFQISKAQADEDSLFLLVSDAGADDFFSEDDHYVVTAPLESYGPLKEALLQHNIRWDQAELVMIPQHSIEISDEEADRNIALIEGLENIDDVDAVYHNMIL